MKRANKNFLLAEYERYRKKPQSVHINNREIIIPCEYTLGGNAPEVVRKTFFMTILTSKNAKLTNIKRPALLRA